MPLYYKLLGASALLTGLFFAGYATGWSSQHSVLVAYRAGVDAAAAAQSNAARAEDAERGVQTRAVAAAYDADVTRLRAALGRLRKPENGSDRVPKTTDRTEGTDVAREEQRGTCEGSEFYAAALEDALTVQKWQEWALRQGLAAE
jgi:hypothetical protein